MIAYNLSNNFSEAEFMLVRNLFKGLITVCFDDSAKHMSTLVAYLNLKRLPILMQKA